MFGNPVSILVSTEYECLQIEVQHGQQLKDWAIKGHVVAVAENSYPFASHLINQDPLSFYVNTAAV